MSTTVCLWWLFWKGHNSKRQQFEFEDPLLRVWPGQNWEAGSLFFLFGLQVCSPFHPLETLPLIWRLLGSCFRCLPWTGVPKDFSLPLTAPSYSLSLCLHVIFSKLWYKNYYNHQLKEKHLLEISYMLDFRKSGMGKIEFLFLGSSTLF